MNDRLHELFRCHCQVPECAEAQARIEANHRALIKSLKRKHRRRVLRIIDDKDLVRSKVAFGCFVQGFCLAKDLYEQLGQYERLDLDAYD